MCGVVGIVNFDRSPFDTDVLKAMSYSIRHRGPDDEGYLGLAGESKVLLNRDPDYVSGSWVGFGHRRLSILDLSNNAWQPMSSLDGSYFIVYNGEVYNYLELRQELEKAGYRFRSNSDTEVVLNAYIEWGKEALNRFVGMFAFAILDIHKRNLFLARDHFGIKPLYYNLTDQTFAFASEIKALLQIPGISRNANSQVVFDFLRYANSDYGGETFLISVKQIPPAHFMAVSLDAVQDIRPVRYWSLNLTEENTTPFDEASRKLRDMFLDNVGLHLRSDVPVGAALSGGIDSSAVVSCIRRIEPSIKLHTFSYVADTPDNGEKKWAIKVGNSVDAILHTIRPSAKDLVGELENLTYMQDQPIASTNMYAQYLVYKLAKQNGIKVVLDGQGADELLAGYDHFYHHRVRSMLCQGKFAQLLAFMRSASKVQPGFKAFRTLLHSSFELLPVPIKRQCRNVLGKEYCPSWINRNWFEKHRISDCGYYERETKFCLRKALHRSLMVDSLPMLLRWQDRNSMAHSVESRVPFLTPKLAEYLFTLPEEYLISHDGTRKSILRSAMHDIVPESVLMRLDKVAFGSPMTAWLGCLIPWINKVLDADILRTIPVFDTSTLRAEWEDVIEGRRPLESRVWRWISLIKWVECSDVRFEEI